MSKLQVRAVVDLTEKPHLRAVLATMLAASLKAFAAPGRSSLELFVLGEPDEGHLALWSGLGAGVVRLKAPHPLSHRSGTYNKLLTLEDMPEDARLLLVDNDVVFRGDPAGFLDDYAEDAVAADVADRERVEPALAQELAGALGQSLMDEAWIPWEEVLIAAREGRDPVAARGLYFNSGAVLLPAGQGHRNFSRLWSDFTERLSTELSRRDLKERKSVGSDQFSLSLAMACWGRLQRLAPGDHCRTFSFRAGHARGPDIRLIHLVGVHRVFGALDVAQRRQPDVVLRQYCAERMIDPEGPEPAREAARKLFEPICDALSGLGAIRRPRSPARGPEAG